MGPCFSGHYVNARIIQEMANTRQFLTRDFRKYPHPLPTHPRTLPAHRLDRLGVVLWKVIS